MTTLSKAELEQLLELRGQLERLYDLADFSLEKAGERRRSDELRRRAERQAVIFMLGMVASLALPYMISRVQNNTVQMPGLISIILAAIGAAAPLGLLSVLGFASRGVLQGMTREYGGRDGSDWRNPSAMFLQVFPFLAEEREERFEQIRHTFADRTARSILKASSMDLDEDVIKEEIRRRARNSANVVSTTEFGFAENAVRSQVLKDYGIRRRRLRNRGDEKVDDVCLRDSLAGWIPVDEPYPSGVMYPPQQHPNCRCVEEADRSQIIRIPDYLRG